MFRKCDFVRNAIMASSIDREHSVSSVGEEVSAEFTIASEGFVLTGKEEEEE